MKTYCLLLLLVLMAIGTASTIVVAQVHVRFNYDSYWRLTRKDSGVFYRICNFDTAHQVFVGEVKDYTKDGKLIMTGAYHGEMRNGHFVSFFRNGKKESEGTFEDNVRVGLWRYFYSNGTPRQEVNFGANDLQILFFNDSTGHRLMTDGTGTWTEDYVEPYTAVKIITKGNFKNHKKNGVWTSMLANGTPWLTSTFTEGRFVSGEMVIEGEKFELFAAVKNHIPVPSKFVTTESFAFAKGITRTDYPYIRKLPAVVEKNKGPGADELYSVVEYSASPIGGLPAFYRAVAANLKYPPDAQKKGIQGKVFLEFVINRDGTLSDFKVIKGLGSGCDEEAIRAVIASQSTVRWRPGIQGRKRVRQTYTLPVPFKIGV